MNDNWQKYQKLEQIPGEQLAPQPLPAFLRALIPLQRGIVGAAISTWALEEQREHLEECFFKELRRAQSKLLQVNNSTPGPIYGVSRADLMATWLNPPNDENDTDNSPV